MKSYYFLCLFRADKSASGLAFRIPILWKGLNKKNSSLKLIINKSLYNKVLAADGKKVTKEDVIIVPEWLGFKISMVFFIPFVLLYIFSFRKIRGMHVSVAGLYFIRLIRFFSKFFNKKIPIHMSIGSKSLEMATGGDIYSKYYKLHYDAMKEVDKIDCLYSPEGFPDFAHKMIQAPGSFSWKYSVSQIKEFEKSSVYKERAILFCGSMIPQKNFRLAFDAYKRYCELNYGGCLAVFYLVSPEISSDLRNEILEFNNISNGEVVIGSYSNIDVYLKKSYIFLSLQDYDNYPSQSLIEAMSFGCTIIATDFGETSKLVKVENGNALINKDVMQLSFCLDQAFSSELSVNYKNINHILDYHSVDAYISFFEYEMLR